MGRIEDLPPKVLDSIVEILLNQSPKDVVSGILGSVSQPIHESACRTIFGRTLSPLIVPDDARLFNASQSLLLLPMRGNPASALIANHKRYGPYVKNLNVVDPTIFAPLDAQEGVDMGSSNLGLFNGDVDVIAEEEEEKDGDDGDSDEDGEGQTRKPKAEGQVRPLDAETLRTILSACEDLEELNWTSSYPPPDGFCEDLVSYNPKLNRICYKPNSQLPSASSNATKWDAPSLPLLAPLITSCNLTHLTLTRLTQTGAISFSLLLNALAEESELTSSSGSGTSGSLQSLELNFVWLDDSLCQRIVKAGRKTLKRLTLGTQGTKLTDVGVVTLLEGLEVLEDFGLMDVEGRLSKGLWTKLTQDETPGSLKKLTIGIPDTGPSHSWSLDHLQSLSSFPLANIRHLAIVRTSASTEGPSIDKGNNLRPVPRDVLKALAECEGTKLTCLECDWWSWSAEDVKVLLERCTKLQNARLAFDAPFAKFLGLASSIASASNLKKLSILIPAEHCPSSPTSPLVATPGNPLSPGGSPAINFSSRTQLTPLRGSVGLPSSPTTSTILRRDSMSKSYTTPSSLPSAYLSGAPSDPAPSSPSMSISGSPLASLNNLLPSLDPALPLLRDMKKLFKRCLALREVEWVGRGLWILDPSCRSSSTAKTTSLANIKVDLHFPRSLSVTAYEEEYERKRIEEEAVKWGWSPSAADRVGQEWIGEAADEVAREREKLIAEKEKEAGSEQATSGRSPVKRRAPSLPSTATTPPAPTPTQAKQVPSALDVSTRSSASGKYRRASNTRRSSASSSTPKTNDLDKPTMMREESPSSSSSSHSHHSDAHDHSAARSPHSPPAETYGRQRGGRGGRGRGRSASDGERRHRAPRNNNGGDEGPSRSSNNGEHGEQRRGGHGRGSHRKPGSSGRGHTVVIGTAHNKRGGRGASARVPEA